ncbi:DUF6436 domain-containing protein [Alteromonas sp. 009811495]|uniref:DUF6436 domain-containing protein n=1 Tax=Alteromonas sp. 009811495 TaxID=3002962 RepID=UPI00237D8C90|nr:DUF6436 domain-containing protein [Alteromonas sp. 009811495]WDT86315.1 DUF6436 domain-containing protein [Alteromonas sp. 009811495]
MIPKSLGWTLLVLWAVSILTALLFYGQRQLSEFDPNGNLLHQSTSPTFDEDVIALLKDNGVSAGTIVHIGTSQDCYCETLTAPHQTQLIERFNLLDFNLMTFNIENTPSLKRILTRVPALMIVDNEFRLRYLGPYATGYGCFTGKNLVERIVTYTQSSPYQGAVVNADAEGCFCS